MFFSFRQLSYTSGFLALLFALNSGAARAQEDKVEEEKKAAENATRVLLQRAEDEYRIFFRRPETVPQFWAAIKFEVNLGKFDLAALHLKQLLQKEPPEEVDKQLLKIEAVEGMSSFLRLQLIRRWSDSSTLQDEAVKNAKTLLDRVTTALEKYLGDPERLNKFVKQLAAPTLEERTFALAELQRARERAVPYIVEALRTSVGTPLHSRLVEALPKLEPEAIPPLLEVLIAADPKDAQDLDLRLTILGALKKRGDKRAVPYLWYPSSARLYPVQIRDKAKELLAYLLETKVDQLPEAKSALTGLAERYYQHKVNLGGRTVKVWPWNGTQLAVTPVQLTPLQAEEYFGMRYARQALDLDPKYEPAQNVLLCLMLERTLGPELDQALLKPMPAKLQQLLASVDADLLLRVLERGLNEGNIPVIVATVQALGQRGEDRAANLASSGMPRGLTRALYYPDRRVQLAAVKALVRMPSTMVPTAAARTVEVLSRLLSSGANPRALVAYVPPAKAADARAIIKSIGLEPVLVKSAKEIFERLSQSSDYDAIFLGRDLPRQELPYLLTNLRADADQGHLPIFVFAPQEKLEALTRSAEKYPNVKVNLDLLLGKADELKSVVDAQIKEAGTAKLTTAERKEFPRIALDILWRMSRGEYPGYDLRPAQEAVVAALANPDMSLQALEILGRIPGQEPQVRLAATVLNVGQGKQRLPAAVELNRHVQKYGLMIDSAQRAGLKAAYQNADEDPALRTQLALLVGSMRPTPQATGVRLFQFRPDLPAPPVKPAEKNEK